MLVAIYILEILFFVGLAGSTVVLVLSLLDDAHTALERGGDKPSPGSMPQAGPNPSPERHPQPA